MPFTQISSADLTAQHIGWTLRITWPGQVEEDDTLIQGRIDTITHDNHGATVELRVGGSSRTEMLGGPMKVEIFSE